MTTPTITITGEFAIPIAGLCLEQIMAYLQTKTDMILYVFDGEIRSWNSMDEVPSDGYYIGCCSHTNPCYWSCVPRDGTDEYWVSSFDAVMKMCSVK